MLVDCSCPIFFMLQNWWIKLHSSKLIWTRLMERYFVFKIFYSTFCEENQKHYFLVFVCLFSDPKPRRRYHRQPGLTLKMNNFDVLLWTFLCQGGANYAKVFGHYDANYKLMFFGKFIFSYIYAMLLCTCFMQ